METFSRFAFPEVDYSLDNEGGLVLPELLFDYHQNEYPTRLWAATLGRKQETRFVPDPDGSTFFVFVHEAPGLGVEFDRSDSEEEVVFSRGTIEEGGYAAFNGEFFISADVGAKVVVIERIGYSALEMVGLPIEGWGRLRYIDGCTDSLLVPPVLKGDACLNALYFPPGIDQTSHTHPSMRVGVIHSGHGECVVPADLEDPTGEQVAQPLDPGLIFIIHAGGQHAFRTTGQAENMVVVAYHPDSDFGAEHEDHPMINRTIVDGVSAAAIDTIHTKELGAGS